MFTLTGSIFIALTLLEQDEQVVPRLPVCLLGLTGGTKAVGMSARTERRSLLLLLNKQLQALIGQNLDTLSVSATLLEVFVHETVLLQLFLSVLFSQLLLDPGTE